MRSNPGACALALVVCLLVPTIPTWAAEEDAEAAKAALEAIKKAQKDPEKTGLGAAVERTVDIHNGLKDSALRKKIQAALGKVLRDAKAGGARSAAATALGALNDPSGAWKQLAKALPAPKAKEAGPAEIAAIRAAAAHAPEAAVPAFLKLMTKGKSLDAAKEAIVALGKYGKSKKREVILKEMLEVMRRHYEAAEAAKQNPKGGSGDRPWKELGEPLVSALNALTGQKHADAPAWLEAHKANKKKLGALFTQPLS